MKQRKAGDYVGVVTCPCCAKPFATQGHAFCGLCRQPGHDHGYPFGRKLGWWADVACLWCKGVFLATDPSARLCPDCTQDFYQWWVGVVFGTTPATLLECQDYVATVYGKGP